MRSVGSSKCRSWSPCQRPQRQQHWVVFGGVRPLKLGGVPSEEMVSHWGLWRNLVAELKTYSKRDKVGSARIQEGQGSRLGETLRAVKGRSFNMRTVTGFFVWFYQTCIRQASKQARDAFGVGTNSGDSHSGGQARQAVSKTNLSDRFATLDPPKPGAPLAKF